LFESVLMASLTILSLDPVFQLLLVFSATCLDCSHKPGIDAIESNLLSCNPESSSTAKKEGDRDQRGNQQETKREKKCNR